MDNGKPQHPMKCIEMTGSDNRMDCRDMFSDPLNPLPAKCDACGFPDLDDVPQPYQLIQSRTLNPNEMAPAENGNILVRPRVRQILELVAPDEVSFYPTHFKGTSEPTPWLLAVAKHQVETAQVDSKIRRCDGCGEPRSAHPGTQFSQWLWNYDSEHHILKSSTWGSSENGWDQWISRNLYLSVRLFSLLGKAGVKGLDEATCGTKTKPDAEDSKWIKTQLGRLEQHGIALHATGTIAPADAKWFRAFLKGHAISSAAAEDWKSLEKQTKFKFPKSYKDFINQVGTTSFHNIDQQQGFHVHLLPPGECDTVSFRSGKLKSDEQSNAVDGVMFARTEHGDAFCFDVRKDRKEYEVFLYLHEQNLFEAYAANFAACIKRFASGSTD